MYQFVNGAKVNLPCTHDMLAGFEASVSTTALAILEAMHQILEMFNTYLCTSYNIHRSFIITTCQPFVVNTSWQLAAPSTSHYTECRHTPAGPTQPPPKQLIVLRRHSFVERVSREARWSQLNTRHAVTLMFWQERMFTLSLQNITMRATFSNSTISCCQ
jgi:hypothetical protein